MARDYTKYTVEGLGENLNKRQLVFTIVKDYVEKNNPSFEDLQKAFPDEVQGSKGFIRKEAMWTFINHFKHENMKITSIVETFRKLKLRTLNVNFILLFSLIVVTNSAFGQDNDLTIEEFNYSNFKKSKKRTGRLSSYPIDKNDVKQIEYTPLQLDDNSIERLTKLISSSLKKLNSLGIVGKLTKNNLSLTSTTSLKIAESSYGVRNVSDGNLTIELSSIYRASIIVSKDNDTLILLPKEISVVNKYTSQRENILLLYYIDLQSCKNIYLENKKLINDVLTLKKHISILKEKDLELTESERKQLNKNIQNRIIDSLNSKLPKFYLTIVNRVEPNSYTKTQRTYSYCYIVEKYASNHFFGLGQKHDTFPIMDVKMVDDPDLKNVYLLDTITIDLYNLEDLKQKIKSTDYLAHFSERNKTLSEKREYYSMSGQTLKENPIVVNTFKPFLTVTDTLYSTKDFGKSDNGINFYLASKPSYEEFLKNHIIIPSENEFPFLNITSIMNMHTLSVTGMYNKSKIYFDVVRSTAKKRSGFNDYDVSKRDYLIYDLDILTGTNRKEMYNYASQFLEYNVEFDKKVQTAKKKLKIAAEEEEKKARQELYSKYGKKYVDAVQELKIIVGMPQDLLNYLIRSNYVVKTNSSSGNGKYYRLEPMDFTPTGWVEVWTKNGKVSSVTYH